VQAIRSTLLAVLLTGCRGEAISPYQPGQPPLAAFDVYAASPTNYVGWVSGPVDSAPTVVVARGTALVSGVTVLFRILEGGGRVGNTVTITDGYGRSTAGDWILGNTPGTQRLGAFVGDSLRVVFTAQADPLPLNDLPPLLVAIEDVTNLSHIFVLDSLSALRRPLTSGAVVDADPQPSPDGQSIAFLRDGQLHRMNRDGSNIRPISQPDSAQPRGRLSWSPDGRRIVFGDAATRGLSLIGTDGGNYVRLTRPGPAPLLCPGCTEYIDGQADWSPDGTEIAFTRNEDLEFTVVWIMNPDGSNARRLGRREPFGNGYRTWASWSPVWSRDHRLLFAGPLDRGTQAIFNMARDGSDVVVVSQLPSLFGCNPADWSANGRWLAMQCWSSSGSEVRLLSLQTRLVTVIAGARSVAFLE
jgi:hypothetical protein